MEFKANPLIEKLMNLEFFGAKLGLENISMLLEMLGNPHKELKFIHVAGTNGKGSVCAILSKALESAGFKVGFFSSPHLVTVRERFRFNNRGISEGELTDMLGQLWPCIDELYLKKRNITFFEANVAIALLYFKREKCDFVVWETGLGGRLDATNLVTPIVSVITSIGLDHQQVLGDTTEKIAFEKAGIIKSGIPLFLGNISESPRSVLERKALRLACKVYDFDSSDPVFIEKQTSNREKLFFYLKDDYQKRFFSLSAHAFYQRDNLSLACAVLKYLADLYGFDLFSGLSGLESLKWHGRFQTLPDGKIIDGAHNRDGIDALIKSIKSSFPGAKFTVIFGCLQDREPSANIAKLSEIADKFIFTSFNTTRKCFEPQALESIARNCKEFSGEINKVNSPREGLILSGKDRTLITGSLYLTGEILSQYYTEDEITQI